MTRFGNVYKAFLLVLCVGFGILTYSNYTQEGSRHVHQHEFSITALVYHRFGDDRYPSTNTTIEQFEAHLKWLKQNKYETYTVSGALESIQKGTLCERAVCITVDDGYRSFMQSAMPLLKKYGMKATLFVNTESVGWPDYLTWNELKEIHSQGIEIGNHSHKHSYFLNKKNQLNDFKMDFIQAEDLFKKHLGLVPKSYAYPYGEYNRGIAQILKDNRISLGFAQLSGVWTEKSNLYSIPRFPMSGMNISIDRFKERLKMKGLDLEGASQFPKELNSSETIKFNYKYDVNHYNKPFNGFLNGRPITILSHLKGQLHIDLGNEAINRRNILTITTRNKEGSWCWHSSLFINPHIEE